MSEVKHFCVDVHVNYRHVLTIESESLSGIELNETDKDGIRMAAQHLLSFVGKKTWEPVSTMPTSGSFLVGVWEGEWRAPRQNFRVYQAIGSASYPIYNRSYRTVEGEAYEIVGWMPMPSPPKEDEVLW